MNIAFAFANFQYAGWSWEIHLCLIPLVIHSHDYCMASWLSFFSLRSFVLQKGLLCKRNCYCSTYEHAWSLWESRVRRLQDLSRWISRHQPTQRRGGKKQTGKRSSKKSAAGLKAIQATVTCMHYLSHAFTCQNELIGILTLMRNSDKKLYCSGDCYTWYTSLTLAWTEN